MNVLPLLETDFVDLCKAMVDGSLNIKKLQLNKKSTVCKYVVPEGYGVKSMIGKKVFVDEEGTSYNVKIMQFDWFNENYGTKITWSMRLMEVE